MPRDIKWADGTAVGKILTPQERSAIRFAAIRIATECATAMARKLEHSTPEKMGYSDMTPEELIASEWRTWFEQELQRLTE